MLHIAGVPAVFFMRKVAIPIFGLLLGLQAYNLVADLFLGRPTSPVIMGGFAAFFVAYLASFAYLVVVYRQGKLL